MSNRSSLTFTSKRTITPEGETEADVRISEGVIREVGPYGSLGNDRDSVDLGNNALLPGLIDAHVHLNEPGRTDWEGFESGSAAAAAGGVTTVVDMPLNSSPVTTTVEALEQKRAASSGKLSCDVAFYGGLVAGSAAHLSELIDTGVVGVKAFLCDSGLDEFPAATEADLREAMPLLAERGIPLLAHAELVSPVPPMANAQSYPSYMTTRPPRFEQDAIRLLIELCRDYGCRTHIVHLADGECLPMLAEARSEGLTITVETCPHYLHFASEDIPDGSTAHKCAPPIRTAANRESLWQGLADGIIDLVGTDHSPCPPELKQLDTGRFDLAWGGISSLQLGLSVVWTGARKRGFSLNDVIKWMSTEPGELVGLPTGIVANQPANLAVFDPEAEWTVQATNLHHRHPITPYEGAKLTGVVRQTYLRGQHAAKGLGQAQ